MDEEHKEKITPPETPEPTAEEVAEAFTEPEPESEVEQDSESKADESIVAKAAAESPAGIAPAFETPEPTRDKKSKKPLAFALLTLFILALGGAGVWYFLLRDKGTEQSAPISNNQQETPTLEPIEASKLALKGNDLSDFDLAFLRLENKQDNVIYSPLSIKYALAMLADGANGRSKEQITALIGDYAPKAYLNSANRSLANAMFIRTDFADQVKDTYKTALESKYNASVILDPFTSPDNANKWVEDKTLGIIKNTFDSNTVNTELDYMLVNALAIDMQWNYKIQCNFNDEQKELPPSKIYSVYYAHEKYYDGVGCMDLYKVTFNGLENIKSGKIATSANRYDIISDKGEGTIRETVQAAFDEWIASDERWDSTKEYYSNHSFDMDNYIKELSENFNRNDTSTDFYFNITDNEKIFAKDLQEYDGSTLQYVGIMPKSGSLNAYINNLTAEKTSALISSLKDPSNNESFKEGVVTKLNGYIPFFKFNFTMDNFTNHLQSLGITDVFSTEDADLSNMIDFDANLANKPYINVAIHKADIDFSNDGIKAAAVTAFGGMGAGGDDVFEYQWDVPVEEIDLTFDKPFLFLIRDKATGEVWFTGTVYNPSSN